MEIRYNVTGAERKRLVSIMAETLNEPARYKGAPSFAYEVGGSTIDKEGTVICQDDTEAERLIEALRANGYEAAGISTSESTSVDEALTAEKPSAIDETLAVDEAPAPKFTVKLPADGFTETALDNLNKLVQSKAGLIRKALGADRLTIAQRENVVSFPWFDEMPNISDIKAYTHFICALCEMAKSQKRITSKEKVVDNEKYAFRCFLLRLGFIGAEFKPERKVLLKNLSGNGAFKSIAVTGSADESEAV